MGRLAAALGRVGALESGRVAGDAVVQERVVAGPGGGVEVVMVSEVHRDGAHANARPRNLRAEVKRGPFLRLDVEDQIVRGRALDGQIGGAPGREQVGQYV